MTVYSTRFIGLAVTAGESAYYTVPEGYVAVVRDISILPTASGLTSAQVAINGVTRFFQVVSATSGVSLHQEMRAVLNPGEELVFDCAGANCYVCISGYLLSS